MATRQNATNTTGEPVGIPQQPQMANQPVQRRKVGNTTRNVIIGGVVALLLVFVVTAGFIGVSVYDALSNDSSSGISAFAPSDSSSLSSISPNSLSDSSSSGSSSNDVSSYLDSSTTSEYAVGSAPGSIDISEKTNTSIIYNGSEALQTTNFDSTYNGVKGIILGGDGYIEDEYITYDNYGISDDEDFRIGSISARVPYDDFDDTINKIEELDNVVVAGKRIESYDVTEDTLTLESRLETEKSKLEQLTALQNEAATLDEKLDMIDRIYSQEQEIARLQDSIDNYDDKVTFSELDITVKEETALGMKSTAIGYGDKLSEAFANGLNNGLDFFGSILLAIASNWLLIIVCVAVIVIGIKLAKRSRDKASSRDNAPMAHPTFSGTSDTGDSARPTYRPKSPRMSSYGEEQFSSLDDETNDDM